MLSVKFLVPLWFVTYIVALPLFLTLLTFPALRLVVTTNELSCGATHTGVVTEEPSFYKLLDLYIQHL